MFTISQFAKIRWSMIIHTDSELESLQHPNSLNAARPGSKNIHSFILYLHTLFDGKSEKRKAPNDKKKNEHAAATGVARKPAIKSRNTTASTSRAAGKLRNAGPPSAATVLATQMQDDAAEMSAAQVLSAWRSTSMRVSGTAS